MKFTVQPWSPDYGSPGGQEELEAPEAKIDVDIEAEATDWVPITVNTEPANEVLFVDGVRRVDANLWIEEQEGVPLLALAASYGAGAVLCTDQARIVAQEVRRGVFTSAKSASDIDTRHGRYNVHFTAGVVAEELWLGLQRRMGELEGLVISTLVASNMAGASLVVVDGPLSHHLHVPGAVGYIKTQQRHYLPSNLRWILPALPPCNRTPMFHDSSSSRFSWYLKLPLKDGGPMDGIVRAEINADHDLAAARRLADLTAATMCRFASAAHKDPRAPQNLYPVGQLERKLHHLLGDRELLYRSLRVAGSELGTN